MQTSHIILYMSKSIYDGYRGSSLDISLGFKARVELKTVNEEESTISLKTSMSS